MAQFKSTLPSQIIHPLSVPKQASHLIAFLATLSSQTPLHLAPRVLRRYPSYNGGEDTYPLALSIMIYS